MAFEAKPNTFALFKNTRKNNEKQPDFTGTLDIEGESFKLAAWSRVSKKGVKFLSGSIKPDESENEGGGDDDGDIF